VLFCCKKKLQEELCSSFSTISTKKKESINGEKNELICMLKKIQRKKLVQQF